MIIRFLGHDGLYYHFAGTTFSGALIWTEDPDDAFIFSTEASAQRMAQKAKDEGHDVEITL
ncbi:MAG: hypothetical protein ACXW13_00025 [Burkholderiaceae bacterium]